MGIWIMDSELTNRWFPKTPAYESAAQVLNALARND